MVQNFRMCPPIAHAINNVTAFDLNLKAKGDLVDKKKSVVCSEDPVLAVMMLTFNEGTMPSLANTLCMDCCPFEAVEMYITLYLATQLIVAILSNIYSHLFSKNLNKIDLDLPTKIKECVCVCVLCNNIVSILEIAFVYLKHLTIVSTQDFLSFFLKSCAS